MSVLTEIRTKTQSVNHKSFELQSNKQETRLGRKIKHWYILSNMISSNQLHRTIK